MKDVNVKIPAGYEVIKDAAFPDTFKFEEIGDTVEGTVLEIKDVELTKKVKGKTETKITRVMTIDTGEKIVGVWESVKLTPLFDMNPVGAEVFIQFTEAKKIKGYNNEMKSFAIGVKNSKTKEKKKPF